MTTPQRRRTPQRAALTMRVRDRAAITKARLRPEHDLTQLQLAVLIGRSRQWVQRVEAGGIDGIETIRFEDAVRICKRLGLDLDAVFEDTNAAAVASGGNPMDRTSEAVA